MKADNFVRTAALTLWTLLIAQSTSTAQTKTPPYLPPPQPRPPVVTIPREVQKVPPKTPSIREQKRQFAQKFTNLINSLNDFSDAYAKTKGEVLPLDKVKAVKAAWRELQKVEPAFK